MSLENIPPPIASSEEKGLLGILHIKRFWSRTLNRCSSPSQDPLSADEWVKDNTLVCGLNLGLREVLQYLSHHPPSFEQFEEWIAQQNGGVIDPNRKERLNAALSGELKAEISFDAADAVFTTEELLVATT